MNKREFIDVKLMCIFALILLSSAGFSGTTEMKELRLDHGEITAIVEHAADERVDWAKSQLAGLTEVRWTLSSGTGSFIRCVALLPSVRKWDGRFHGWGSGGGAGFINLPLAFTENGGAAAYTDMGSSVNMRDNSNALIDYGHRATHLMTESAKRIVTAFYGRPPHHSYFHGESTGGGQALHEATRYPQDYDGIVAGVPVIRRLGFFHDWVHRQRFSRDGKDLFTAEQYETVRKAGLAYFNDKDEPWARGKCLTDPNPTPERTEAILTIARRMDPSLNDPDLLGRLRKIYSPVQICGVETHPAMPYGTSITQAGSGSGDWFKWRFGTRSTFDVTDEERRACAEEWGPILNSDLTDLSSFRAAGGKLLVYGGLADGCIPGENQMAWYRKVVSANGGQSAVDVFMRLYMLPGRYHVAGAGPAGVQSIDSERLIIAWVERGIPPGVVDGVVKGGGTHPIAPYHVESNR